MRVQSNNRWKSRCKSFEQLDKSAISIDWIAVNTFQIISQIKCTFPALPWRRTRPELFIINSCNKGEWGACGLNVVKCLKPAVWRSRWEHWWNIMAMTICAFCQISRSRNMPNLTDIPAHQHVYYHAHKHAECGQTVWSLQTGRAESQRPYSHSVLHLAVYSSTEWILMMIIVASFSLFNWCHEHNLDLWDWIRSENDSMWIFPSFLA